MAYLRLDNFGTGGFNPDLYESGLAPGQISEMENADIYNGDIYACGAEPQRIPSPGFQILYSYIYQTENLNYYIASDGIRVAAWDGFQWIMLYTALKGGIVTYANFLGTLVINSLSTGPFYWGGERGVESEAWDKVTPSTDDDTWDNGAAVDWADAPLVDDSWDFGDPSSWNAGADVSWQRVPSDEALSPLPGWPSAARCLQIEALGNYLVAVSVYDEDGDGETSEPYLVWWSDAAAPGLLPASWTPATSNLAGDFRLQDTGGPITAAKQLRDSLIIYKSDSIYRMFQTFDENTVMAYERIVSNPSVDSPYGVADYANFHYMVTRAGLYRFDGQSVEPIDTNRVHGAVLAQSLYRSFSRVQVVANITDSEIWMGFRNVGVSPLTIILRYHILYDSFSVHSISEGLTSLTSGAISLDDLKDQQWDLGPDEEWNGGTQIPWKDVLRGELIERVFLARTTGVSTYEPNLGGKLDKSVRETRLLRYGITLGVPGNRVVLRALYPEMEGGDAVVFRVGTQMQPWRSLDGQEPQIRWGPERRFRPGTDRKIPLRDIGSVFALEIKSTEARDWWRLHAVGVEFDAVGKRG